MFVTETNHKSIFQEDPASLWQYRKATSGKNSTGKLETYTSIYFVLIEVESLDPEFYIKFGFLVVHKRSLEDTDTGDRLTANIRALLY